MAVYLALIEPGDKILSLDLTHGGHLSHGHPANFAGKTYEVEHYEVDADTGYVDYDGLHEHAKEFEPDVIVSGFSAYPRAVDWERVQETADEVDAYHLADVAHITGLIAAGEHPSPVGVADVVTGSTHKTIRAGRGGIVLTNDDDIAEAVDSAVFPGVQGGPAMHNIAGKAVGFCEALEPAFEEYIAQVTENAQVLAETLQDEGFGLVSGGTDTHLVLVDLRESHPDVSGGDIEDVLEEVGIVLNANTVPGETRSAFDPSGIRIGTPGVTSRGFGPEEMETVARAIADIVDSPDDEAVKESVRETVRTLCDEFPVYE
jgi:glycine hydroxymethyltransferase